MEADPFIPAAPPSDPDADESRLSDSSRFLFQRPLVGATLYNLGNTCFMNAVLQCITHTVPLVEKLHSNSHDSTCSADNDDEFCSFCALRDHVDRCIVMSGSVISPRNFVYNLSKISSYFEPGEQQDAHEFLGYFLDSIDSSFFKPNLKHLHSSLFEADSPVNQVFRGRLKSQLQCSDCGHCSDTYEHLLNLSLEIDDVESLTDALESFTRKEKIDDLEEKFTCNGCNAKVSMEKQLKIDQPPTVLILHLKRFKLNGMQAHKICKFVKYPLELDLRPYMTCPTDDEQTIYDLYAIVVHNGSCYSGHYYCNVRTSITTWHQMNDSLKGKISERSVLDQEAYILFYIKKGSHPWFSSLMDIEKVPLPSSSLYSILHSDLASSSGEEASCSSSREIFEKDEGSSLCASTSLLVPNYDELQEDYPASICPSAEIYCDLLPESSPSKDDRISPDISNHPATHHTSPGPLSNIGVSDVGKAAGRFLTKPTKRLRSDHHIVDVFTDEPFDEDKENQIIPQNHVGSKRCSNQLVGSKRGSNELGKHIINVAQEAELQPLRRLMKGMHSSRRSSILACLDNSAETPSKRLRTCSRRSTISACLDNSSETPSKRLRTSMSDPPLDKRQRMTSDHISGGKGKPQYTSIKGKILGPHSISTL